MSNLKAYSENKVISVNFLFKIDTLSKKKLLVCKVKEWILLIFLLQKIIMKFSSSAFFWCLFLAKSLSNYRTDKKVGKLFWPCNQFHIKIKHSSFSFLFQKLISRKKNFIWRKFVEIIVKLISKIESHLAIFNRDNSTKTLHKFISREICYT